MDFMDFPSGSLLIILIIRVYFTSTNNLYNPYNPCLFSHNYNLYPCFYIVANRRRTTQ